VSATGQSPNLVHSRRWKSFTTRSHYCGELDEALVGSRVRISGWVQHLRMDKFLVLRDGRGTVQLVVPDDKQSLWSDLNQATLESVLDISGTVIKRPEGQENLAMDTGRVEVAVDTIEALVPSVKKLPFYISDRQGDANERLRMTHRYLDLRRPVMQRNLRTRSELVTKIRQFLTDHDFLDIETPTLFRRTPGGAREFVVPTRHPGKFYSLVQSPQQFKQLLMVGGFEKYFQIAKCYRDEGARPDRQPEFTQVDVEMAFTDRQGVMDMVEALLRHSWPASLPPLPQGPFEVRSYDECMQKYGSDKPDLRFDNPIRDVTPSMRRFASGSFRAKVPVDDCCMKVVAFDAGDLKPTTATMRAMEKEVRKQMHVAEGEVLIVSNFSLKSECEILSSLSKRLEGAFAHDVIYKLNLKPTTVGFFVIAKRPDLALDAAGRLRLALTKQLIELDPTDFKFLWVQDFPMFLPKEDEVANGAKVESAHHPFTQPHPDDIKLLESDPLAARSLHYDLVLNGTEVGGGSIRINDPKLQKFVLSEVLGEDVSQLSHLLEAFSYGCPPHGGIALGLDRLAAILCNADSIRDVIAFPKGGEGKDPMSHAPAEINPEDQQLYHIKVVDPK